MARAAREPEGAPEQVVRLLAQVGHLERAEVPAARAAAAECQPLVEGAAPGPMEVEWAEHRLSEASVERWLAAEPWERAEPLAQEAAQLLQVGRRPVAVPATRAEGDRVTAAQVARGVPQVAAPLRRVTPQAAAARWGPAAVTPG